ncbi:hypothetical protein AX17_006987 [Amanita inopinata Kibby_2008]|nr:hypothetical protein AX17_006987 [Amanita inopinata Kibby_2008]
MEPDQVIDLTDNDDDDDDRRSLLFPIITRVVDALGGFEAGAYRLGDEALSCLKDLKKLWRKDDDDDERTVARIFHETQVLPNDLIPILLLTAGKGLVDDKHAVACADLMTAMTWPIDMAEELKELDDELDRGTDYTQLLRSHLEYKSALLKPGVMQALFGVVLPPLAKAARERTERDGQVVNLVLHLIRNLAFIRDLNLSAYVSSDSAAFSMMQSRLVMALDETHVLRLLLTVAANADGDKMFENWNTLVLEIVYLLVRGVKPADLAMDQAKQPGATLHRLLAAEERTRRDTLRKASSRHSHFGTTIAVTLNSKKKTQNADGSEETNEPSASSSASARPLVLHRQQAVTTSAGMLLDLGKKQKGRKGLTVDELAREDNLSLEARKVLQEWACDFLDECFNSFISTLIRDIRSERPKITEKDHLRLLYVSKWFLEFFLALRSKATQQKDANMHERWNSGLVAQVTEREWIGWVFKRMREAVEEKPKLWIELQAGIDCLTQLLLLLDSMASSATNATLQENQNGEDEFDLSEQATVLQQQLIYNGEILDLALESLRAYRPGTQSLKYLDASVAFTWALIRMVERMNKRSKTGPAALVRQKKMKKRKRKNKGKTDDHGDDEEEDGNESEIEIREIMFTFEAFEMKLANAEITNTLLAYLARYKEFASSESMRRIVSLLHRQAVRAKAEGLFFNVSTLELFQTILADQKSFPREQPYKDLISLINFILRQFFKALEKDSFLAVEAFFPKNRGNWKQYSSWEPEAKSGRRKRGTENAQFPPEVRVKKGYSWSDQLGITIAALTEAGQDNLVEWTKQILTLVIAQRKRIIEETDGMREEASDGPHEDDEADDLKTTLKPNKPSAEALAKITDYSIPYVNDEQANAASRNAQLKLLFRLCKFVMRDDDTDEIEWYVPAAVLVADLESTLVVFNQFIANPIDLEGKKACQLLSKQTRHSRRRRKRSTSTSDEEANLAPSDDEPRRKKKEKKKKEKQQYKSAQFIEDSDAEYGDIEGFLEKEKVVREKAVAAAAQAGVTDRPVGMRATGTRKRRRKVGDEGKAGKRRKKEGSSSQGTDDSDSDGLLADSDSDAGSVKEVNVPLDAELVSEKGGEIDREGRGPRRPRPRPLGKYPQSPPMPMSMSMSISISTSPPQSVEGGHETMSRRRIKRLVLSDDEDE